MERKKIKELQKIAEEKNGERSQEQMKKFSWKVIGQKLRKWCIRNRSKEYQEE